MLGSRSRSLALAILGCLALAGRCQAQVTPVSATATSPAAGQGEFVNRVFTDSAGEHKYVVFVPANYSSQKKWPVILFLHGACNRGTDGRSQLVSGLAPSIRLRQAEYPFLVVFPQCEDTQSRVLGGWTDQPEDAERALKILDAVENDYSVDKKRECLVGLSMGGSGAYEIAAKSAKRWSALVPVRVGLVRNRVPPGAPTPGILCRRSDPHRRSSALARASTRAPSRSSLQAW